MNTIHMVVISQLGRVEKDVKLTGEYAAFLNVWPDTSERYRLETKK